MDLSTPLGILIGVAATVAVGHYYYRRTATKSLTPYLLLSSRVFSGIDPLVRQELRFTFRQREVVDLQEIQVLIANDGERAISNCIEPLKLELPADTEVLDASIIYRHPEALRVDIASVQSPPNPSIVFAFPLLNKFEFFAVKLLLSGKIEKNDLVFSVLADDLPRTLQTKWLPQSDTRDKVKIDWTDIVIGSLFLLVAACCGYSLFLLRGAQPGLFPYPWPSFHLSLAAAIVILAVAGTAFLAFLGLVGVFGIGLEGAPSRRPRFALPAELLRRGHRPDFGDILEAAATLETADQASASKATTRERPRPDA